MEILHSEVVPVRPGTTPDYNQNNPVTRLLAMIESASLASGRENYPFEELQFLFPIRSLQLYGPSAPDSAIIDPRRQDNKLDFQKQNVASFEAADTQLIRGLACAGDWTGPFLRLTYRAGPDSVLAAKTSSLLGPSIKLWVKVGESAVGAPLTVPYDADAGRYAIEFWGWPGSTVDLRAALDPRGQGALDRGAIVANTALVPGTVRDFTREALDGKFTDAVAPNHALHPTRPLHVEAAWGSADGTVWDSLDGANHQFEFSMILRGWEHYLSVGTSPNPHGGLGFLEYRNLLSNYGQYAGMQELGRTLPPWSFDAFGKKAPGERREAFMAVDYMDLHIVRANAAIGLHRHRDNQELFMVIGNRDGLMVVGDWCEMPNRERCFEVRTLKPGHFAMLKGGNLHSLINPSDEDLFLFMFGGYD